MEFDIQDHYREIENKIIDIKKRVHRENDEINLVVVTKLKSAENVRKVVDAGAKILGENYPEETHRKISELGETALQVEWHMIGHLQSRKIKFIVEHFSMIHSIDSLEIARELNNKLVESGKTMKALFEVNVSGEESKHGFSAWQTELWPSLVEQWMNLQKETPALNFVGLMTMPPYAQKAEDSRIYFEKCRELLAFARSKMQNSSFKELSMGTSLDYEVAIEEGATYIRIGEAIMGKREY